MSQDLIERLRACGESLAPSPMHTACQDAATALEQQAAEIARLRAALQLVANAESSALDLAYCKGVARAAIAAREST